MLSCDGYIMLHRVTWYYNALRGLHCVIWRYNVTAYHTTLNHFIKLIGVLPGVTTCYLALQLVTNRSDVLHATFNLRGFPSPPLRQRCTCLKGFV